MNLNKVRRVEMSKKIKVLFVTVLMLISVAFASQNISAQTKTGWVRTGNYYRYYDRDNNVLKGWLKIGKNIYFLRTSSSGNAPVGSRVTGLCKIGSKKYYFNANGVLQTGWKTIKGKFYYFEPTGSVRNIGAMATGFKIIDNGRYYFNEDGTPKTGWVKYKTYKYYMGSTKQMITHGRAITGWKWIGGAQYCFRSNGVMITSQWIRTNKGNYYYVGPDGKKLVNCITPDGYIVDANGIRGQKANGWVKINGATYYYKNGVLQKGWLTLNGKKYYLNETTGQRVDGWLTLNGSKYYFKYCVLQTGWQTIGGKQYYFDLADGKMAVNTRVDGIRIGEDGVADPTNKDVQILLIAGHGQGDVGAQGFYSTGVLNEYLLTREFSTMIYKNLQGASPKIKVTMYDQNYNCYAVNAGQKQGPDPNFKKYDYVLEIHFNATATANKDPKGDGNYKGVGMFINYKKLNRTLDYNISKAVASVGKGFKLWGGGLVLTGSPTDKGLLNARLCQEKGISYGLLETAFIDDKDDMDFYKNNKTAMAKAVSDAIVKYYQ